MIKNRLVIIAILQSLYCANIQSSKVEKHFDYKFYFTPTWILLDEPYYTHLFGYTSWVQVGMFTIRMKEPSHLHSLTLQWNGPVLEDIHSASLYRGIGKNIKPTNEYLICDGHWYQDKKGQKLIFDFPYPEKLHVSTTLYLVLTVTDKLEKELKQGTFLILPDNLPLTLQKTLLSQPLYVTFITQKDTPTTHTS